MGPTRRILIGIGLTSLSTLAMEVVLTRIFSVTLWYHFAFLTVAMALLGNAVAGVVLYFFPQLTAPDRAWRWGGMTAAALAVALPLCFWIYEQIPVRVRLVEGVGARDVWWLVVVCLDLLVPFFLSGLTISLMLSSWSGEAGRLYWADLTGAALGCLFSVFALDRWGGVGALLSIGVGAALAGVAFWWPLRRRWGALVLALLAVGLMWGSLQWGWFAIEVNKSGDEEAPRVYEHWNAYSRVTVYEVARYPFFWSLSGKMWEKVIQEGGLYHALLLIDAVAGTPIQEFRGNLDEVRFLRYDLTSFVYHVVDRPETLVIGAGGGRDVLAALASGAPHVVAVEVNPAVIDAVDNVMGEFSGHLYRRPDVTLAIDDARGYIARAPQRFDVIQASLIDTWAAGASGAFALSENSLYTVEAFETYYEHLSDRGVLSISRWYLPGRPAEMLRLLSTAMTGWERAGVADPRLHVAVIAHFSSASTTEGLATALFKRTPFTREEIDRIWQVADELGYTVLYVPGMDTSTEEVGLFASAEDREAIVRQYPVDISPATDDRPFFFNLVRLSDLFDERLAGSGIYRTSMEAMQILLAVLGVTTGLAVLLIVIPLWVGGRRRGLVVPPAGVLIYFGALGVAFMLVELPMIHRLSVYLGRPVYSLAVALFALLLFSGVGSLCLARMSKRQGWRPSGAIFGVLVGVLICFALVWRWIGPATIIWPLPARLVVSVLTLAPMGLLMGMPFPMGLRWAGQRWPGSVPWMWGINGVFSVFGSAMAVMVAIHVGLTVAIMVAAGLYAVAGYIMVREERCA